MQVTVYSFIKPINTGIDDKYLPKIETREVNSYISSIHPNVDVETIGQEPPQVATREVNSFVSPIQSNTEHFMATFRSVEGYCSPIHSNVSTSVLNGLKEVRDVSSYISQINTNVHTIVYRQPISVKRSVSGHTRQIQVDTDVLTHLATIPIQATISVVENPSSTFYIKNPSHVEVIEWSMQEIQLG